MYPKYFQNTCLEAVPPWLDSPGWLLFLSITRRAEIFVTFRWFRLSTQQIAVERRNKNIPSFQLWAAKIQRSDLLKITQLLSITDEI
jgi:hypothetical protein